MLSQTARRRGQPCVASEQCTALMENTKCMDELCQCTPDSFFHPPSTQCLKCTCSLIPHNFFAPRTPFPAVPPTITETSTTMRF
jgi:hypothetical protein